jgi:carboxymethylenebutenolidase
MTSQIPSGFPNSIPSVQTQVVHTDATGLEAGEVRLPVSDGDLPAYCACPATGGPFPVVLVVQEIFGVHEHIQDICRRLAKLGYLAIAPELYARIADVSKMTDMSEILSRVVSRAPDSQIMSDLDAAIDWAIKSGMGDADRMAVTGFCWGGRITWLYCAHNPKLKAGVAWYGRLEGQASELQPKFPLDIASLLEVPVLGLYGGADQAIPVESIKRMRSVLGSARSTSEIVIYPDAPHAFFADYRPNYRREPAEDGWKRLLAWFGAHMKLNP